MSSVYEPDLLDGMVINRGLDLINKFGSFFSLQNHQSDTSELPYICDHHLVNLFSNRLYCPHVDKHTLKNIRIVASAINATDYSMRFPIFGRRELRHGDVFLADFMP